VEGQAGVRWQIFLAACEDFWRTFLAVIGSEDEDWTDITCEAEGCRRKASKDLWLCEDHAKEAMR
jgi:hypothetical protein